MGGAVELSDIHNVVLVFKNGSLVAVYIEVVGCAEDSHHTWEAGRPSLPVHPVSGILGFMGADDGKKVVLFKEAACSGVGEKIRAASNVVVNEELLRFLLAKLFKRIRPENVAHQAMSWRFSEAVDSLDVFEGS